MAWIAFFLFFAFSFFFLGVVHPTQYTVGRAHTWTDSGSTQAWTWSWDFLDRRAAAVGMARQAGRQWVCVCLETRADSECGVANDGMLVANGDCWAVSMYMAM